MSYKGYSARIEFDAEDRVFVGHIAGIRDIVSFHGSTVDELEEAFHQATDDYLTACEELGQSPNKPYSGKLMLRVPPETHAAVATAAELNGKSINQWATDILDKAAHG
ncbi:type II toxin-antitoxin system HicB family antitoxin [Endothiovibrio diazotrophicus]